MNTREQIHKLADACQQTLDRPGMVKGRVELTKLLQSIRNGTNADPEETQLKNLVAGAEFALTTPGMIPGRTNLAATLEEIKMANTRIIISPFCKARDQKYCTIPLEEKLEEIHRNLPKAKPGYRPGVLLVRISPEGFLSQIRTLQENDVLSGNYVPRKEGETPRKEIRVAGSPDPLAAVDVVLYSRETLAEGNENSDLTADYEVITCLTLISEEEQPMPPETLMANHFLDSGGTATGMNDSEFVNALRKSYEFWRGRALITQAAFQHISNQTAR